MGLIKGRFTCLGRLARRWPVWLLAWTLSLGTSSAPAAASAESLPDSGAMEQFIDRMAGQHDFDRGELRAMFRQAQFQPGILKAMDRPAEAKPWDVYRPLFVNPGRIDGGVEFWHDNSVVLVRAREQYGVPEAIVTAIIGVETRYGRNTGSYRVIDALTTLAFGYPPRADFFRDELENYLLLSREEGMDPLAIKGSYAGAIGIGQFMPSSYRRYGVDFDGKGRRDLYHDVDDAIGSVANYLMAYGWQPGQPVAVPARIRGEGYESLLQSGFGTWRTVAQMRELGVTPQEEAADDQQVVLLRLERSGGAEYWLGFKNFYVLTRYNRSVYYAMAVYQLSREIKAQRAAAQSKVEP